MSGSAFEERGSRMQRQVVLVKQSTATLALVADESFVEVDPPRNKPNVEKGQMATKADVDAFWNKAAERLKPQFDAISDHVDLELKPVKSTLAEHTKHLHRIAESLEEINKKLK